MRQRLNRHMVYLLAAVLAVVPALGNAQALSCAVPAQIDRPRLDSPDARTPRRIVPTASYTLALSWAPQFCRERGEGSFQCGRASRFGFVLHGLWPDGAGRDWPQYCRPVPLLSEATLRANLCATPSVQLLQHEWAKHGSCMVGSADDYFRRATGLYAALRFPDMDALSRRSGLTVGTLAASLARSNPGLSPAMMRITTTRGGWLDEIWVCLDLNFRYRVCPRDSSGASSPTRLKIWRDMR